MMRMTRRYESFTNRQGGTYTDKYRLFGVENGAWSMRWKGILK